LRTGIGAFYENLDRNQSSVGFSQSTDYVGSLDGGRYPSACAVPATCQNGPPTGPYSLVNPFPTGFAVPPGASGGPLAGIGNSVSYVPRHYKIPRTYQYSFGIQHELPKGVLIDASFSGNKQLYGTFDFDMNWPAGAAGLALQ